VILSILLGPYAAFLVIASVLTVQAFLFADGGLLALGCNIFNLGFFPAFIAYPLIYKPIAGGARAGWRFWVGTMLAAVIGLQLGAFGVVVETTLSGISDLPFRTFVLMMQPIHLAIGIVEGLVTAAVVTFVFKTCSVPAGNEDNSLRHAMIGILAAAVILGGGLSLFASKHPDGLEWAMGSVSGREKIENPAGGIHQRAAVIQKTTALLPDYGFRDSKSRTGTSMSGVVGGITTLILAGLIGYGLRRSIRSKSGVKPRAL